MYEETTNLNNFISVFSRNVSREKIKVKKQKKKKNRKTLAHICKTEAAVIVSDISCKQTE